MLAEIAPGENGAGPRSSADEPEARPTSAAGEATVIEIEMPAMGESVSEGTILEWAKQPGDSVAEDETIVEISTDKVDAEVPAPAAGTLTEILADAGDTVTVGQVIARMTSGNGAAPAEGRARRPEPTEARPAGDTETIEHARRPEGHAGRARVAAAQGVDLDARSQGTGPDGRIGKADVLALPRATAPRAAPAARAHGRQADAAQGRERDARALHGRVAADPDRDLLPHVHRHHARRPPQAAQGGRPARSPSRT